MYKFFFFLRTFVVVFFIISGRCVRTAHLLYFETKKTVFRCMLCDHFQQNAISYGQKCSISSYTYKSFVLLQQKNKNTQNKIVKLKRFMSHLSPCFNFTFYTQHTYI